MPTSLERRARRLFERIQQFDDDLATRQEKLGELKTEKRHRLSEAVLSSRGDGTATVQRLTEKIQVAEQELADHVYQRQCLYDELLAVAGKIKTSEIQTRRGRLEDLKEERQRISDRIRQLHAEMQRLKAKISLSDVWLDGGEPIQLPKKERIGVEMLTLETEITSLEENLGESEVLARIGVDLGALQARGQAQAVQCPAEAVCP